MAKRKIFVNFTYNGEELRGQVDFQRSTRKDFIHRSARNKIKASRKR